MHELFARCLLYVQFDAECMRGGGLWAAMAVECLLLARVVRIASSCGLLFLHDVSSYLFDRI